MITITKKVRDHFERLLDKSGVSSDDRGVRVGVKAGGCSGLEYYVEPAAKRDKFDKVMILLGIRVFIDPKSMAVMVGTEIDYSDNFLDKHPLIFKNPKATSACGCGVSFQLK